MTTDPKSLTPADVPSLLEQCRENAGVEVGGVVQPTNAAIDAALRHLPENIICIVPAGDGSLVIDYGREWASRESLEIDANGSCERYVWNNHRIVSIEAVT